MKRISLIASIISILFFIGCSKDNPVENNNNNNTSKWTGNWESYRVVNFTDSLVINANLTEKNGELTGSGTAYYTKTDPSVYRAISGNFTGTLNEPNITVTATDKTTGDTFKFTGTEEENLSFKGTCVLTIDGTKYTESDIYFFKK